MTSPAPATPALTDVHDGLSLGVGWPYVGLKYFFNDDIGAEFRFATDQGINVYALRGYWSFERFSNFRLLTGLEAGYITFDTMNADNTLRVTGTGNEVAPFFGTEYFLSREISLLIDFSMPVISLTSKGTSLGDLQWVFNGGIYFYPF